MTSLWNSRTQFLMEERSMKIDKYVRGHGPLSFAERGVGIQNCLGGN